MFQARIFRKPGRALPLALSLFALPASAQQPAPAPPPDLAWHAAAPDEAQPPPLPPAPPDGRLCEDPLCRARLVGDLWKKGGVALDLTPFRW